MSRFKSNDVGGVGDCGDICVGEGSVDIWWWSSRAGSLRFRDVRTNVETTRLVNI